MQEKSTGNDMASVALVKRRSGRLSLFVTLMITTAAVGPLVGANPAFAQTAASKTVFNIAPQPLAQALTQFSNVTGVQLFFDADIARGINSPGATGSLTRDEVLGRILAGSGLTYKFTNASTVAILQAADIAPIAVEPGVIMLDTINVQSTSTGSVFTPPPEYAGGQVATGAQLGLLGNSDVMHTPFNQTSFTATKVADQQAQTIRDVLIDDPSVRSVIPDNGPGEDRVNIRGFQVPATNMSYGGLYGVLPAWSATAEIAERVEVLKGPSAMLNGMPPQTGIGGTINLVPKHATDDPITEFTADYSSAAHLGGHLDVGRRFGENNEFGVRFNGVYRDGDTAIDDNSETRALTVLGLDYRGDNVRLSADIGYQAQHVDGVVPYLGVAGGVPVPDAPSATTNFGQPWSYRDVKDAFGVVRGEIDLTDNITAYAALGARDNQFKALLGSTAIVTNTSGDALLPVAGLSQYDKDVSGEAGVRASFDTGPFSHQLGLSVSALSDETGLGRSPISYYTTNIYSPIEYARPGLTPPDPAKTGTLDLASLALADTISMFDGRVQVTAGARWQSVRASNYDPLSGAVVDSYDDSAFTPSIGVVVQPLDNVSVYGNIIQGLQQGLIVDGTYANAGEIFAPYKSTQYEAGVKVDWGQFTTTLSAFQITQPSTVVDVASNTLELNGEQRNRGIELNTFGEVADGVRVLGGIMLLDPILTKTQDGLADGWTAAFSPTVHLNLGAEWDTPFIEGLTLTGRLVYTSAQYIDTSAPRREIPEWARVDLGARYTVPGSTSPTSKPITIRFDVENVLGTDYIASGFAGTAMNVGAPRTFRLSTSFQF